jgi:hypothetical protein
LRARKSAQSVLKSLKIKQISWILLRKTDVRKSLKIDRFERKADLIVFASESVEFRSTEWI